MMDFGVIVPQGWLMDLVGISDPAEAYETMTRVAQEADTLGYHSIWLNTLTPAILVEIFQPSNTS